MPGQIAESAFWRRHLLPLACLSPTSLELMVRYLAKRLQRDRVPQGNPQTNMTGKEQINGPKKDPEYRSSNMIVAIEVRGGGAIIGGMSTAPETPGSPVYIDRTPKIDFQAQKSCHRQTPRLKEPALRVKQEGEFMPLCFDGGGKWQHSTGKRTCEAESEYDPSEDKE
ncbi:hypothetical protein B0H14DRAFT_2560578 [Mycena olivaceomarginata]|nr:hypothetical protein B0H14DRAFT_2560578 [Mycena olivaceomarginata]